MTMIQANNKVFIVLGCSIIINKEYLKTQLNRKRTLKTLTIDLRGTKLEQSHNVDYMLID
ncbi:hypothetical protein BLOT_000239 [Blomia tropicalis]|nr:hypothetical protein BLOT_000239 [Blomia tropicalis]